MEQALRTQNGTARTRRSAAGLEPLWWPVATALVLLLQAVLVLRHEPFVDEWQALQIAVQSPGLTALLANLRYEGHPPLWYLLLRGVANIAGPRHALAAAALPLAWTTQALILWRSPFPRWLRLLIALGEPVLFEYGAISRSYTLGVMLVFWAVAAWRSRRWFWLPLALLPLTDFLFGCLSLPLLALRMREQRLWWPGVAGWAAASLLAAWTIYPAPDFVPVYRAAASPWQGTALLLFQLSSVAAPLQWSAEGPLWSGPLPFGLYRVMWLPFVWLCWEQTRGRRLDRAAVFGLLLVLWTFYAFLYSLANRHLMLLGVLLVALQWRRWAEGDAPSAAFAAWAAVGAVCGLVAAASALVVPFDTAPAAARIIRERGLTGKAWVAAPAQHGQGIAAMTGMRFQGAGMACTSDFIRWNFPRTIDDARALGRWVDGEAARRGGFYLLSEVALPPGVPAVRLARVPAGFDGKAYFLYRIAPDRPEGTRILPPCVPGMRPFPGAGA